MVSLEGRRMIRNGRKVRERKNEFLKKEERSSYLGHNRLPSALHPVDSGGLLVRAEVSGERDYLHVGEDVLKNVLMYVRI